MMTPDHTGASPTSTLAHKLARLLRHEVGDLLQSVYSTTAILLDRAPEGQVLERRLLGDLKQRAEVCRFELDSALDLVTQPALAASPLDLVPLLNASLAGLRGRFPALRISGAFSEKAPVQADPRALNSALSMLLLGLAQAAKEEVCVEARNGPQQVEIELRRDGSPVSAEQLAWLTELFATTQHALFGMALALTARAVRSAGGQVEATGPKEGGVCVRILIPVHAAA